jgi:hypothetical protein
MGVSFGGESDEVFVSGRRREGMAIPVNSIHVSSDLATRKNCWRHVGADLQAKPKGARRLRPRRPGRLSCAGRKIPLQCPMTLCIQHEFDKF